MRDDPWNHYPAGCDSVDLPPLTDTDESDRRWLFAGVVVLGLLVECAALICAWVMA